MPSSREPQTPNTHIKHPRNRSFSPQSFSCSCVCTCRSVQAEVRGQPSGSVLSFHPEAEPLFPLLLQCGLLAHWSTCFPEASCSCLPCHGGCAGIKDVSLCIWIFNVGSGDLNVGHQSFEESGLLNESSHCVAWGLLLVSGRPANLTPK